MAKHSKHQQSIIRNYYQNKGAIGLQRLSELVTDLYLAEGKQREFHALMGKVLDGTATADEQTRFWKLARETEMVEKVISDLEAKVNGAPKDIAARMNLAQGYIAKLLSIPGGPEQGIWAMKAELQWGEVIKQDENHWKANYSIAESWSW